MLESIRLFFIFLKVGFISFGGGYGMIPVIYAEAMALGITSAQYADLIALDLVVPGPIAINSATYVGYLHDGFFGAFAASVGVTVPSFVLVLLVMYFMDKFKRNTIAQDFLNGVKPAAVGLIVAAALTIAADVLVVNDLGWESFFADPIAAISPVCVMIFLGVAVLDIRFKVNPILLTMAGGVAGALFLS